MEHFKQTIPNVFPEGNVVFPETHFVKDTEVPNETVEVAVRPYDSDIYTWAGNLITFEENFELISANCIH